MSEAVTTVVVTAIVGFAGVAIFAGSFAALRAGRHAGVLLATYIGVGLEFLLAAGLIRLAQADTFAMLGLAAGIIAVRRMVSFGLGYAARVAA